jgi:FtsP/CotA-like multicopper oxidase with cupredoxin domain
VVILLHDFSFTPAEELLAKLKSGGMGGMNMQGMDHSKMPGMSMGDASGTMDLNDIEYDAYLANDRTLDDPEVVQVEKGGTVRLRIINGATATGFTIDTIGLDGAVIAVDGQDIQPHKTRWFPLSMGQRADFRIHIPSHGAAFPIFALREGGKERTGIILATAGAQIERYSAQSEKPGPVLKLDFEKHLQAKSPLARKAPDRSFIVTLAGDMKTYAWSMQSDSEIKFRQGERVAVEMRNMSMMAHPMHLHGHHFQIVAIDGKRIAGAVRDTVLVPPTVSVTFAFDAINPGDAWAFHCHHLYHMASGMMTTAGYTT